MYLDTTQLSILSILLIFYYEWMIRNRLKIANMTVTWKIEEKAFMVANISSSSLTKMYETNSVSKNTMNLANSSQDEFESQYTPNINVKEECFTYCTNEKYSTIEQYTNARKNWDSSQLTADDYKAEYSEYMKSRGCDNEAELTALNSFKSYSLTTKQQLLDYAGILAEQASATLYGNGFTSERVMDSTSKSLLMSNASLQDIADYANAFDSDQSPAGGISSFKSFIDKVASTSGVDEGLKTKLVQMSKEISNSSDAIAEFCDKIEKQAETQRKLDSEFEIQKYNVS